MRWAWPSSAWCPPIPPCPAHPRRRALAAARLDELEREAGAQGSRGVSPSTVLVAYTAKGLEGGELSEPLLGPGKPDDPRPHAWLPDLPVLKLLVLLALLAGAPPAGGRSACGGARERRWFRRRR